MSATDSYALACRRGSHRQHVLRQLMDYDALLDQPDTVTANATVPR